MLLKAYYVTTKTNLTRNLAQNVYNFCILQSLHFTANVIHYTYKLSKK